ncbi:hypothetical protein CR513_03250, partial [Mucuna pruriens]
MDIPRSLFAAEDMVNVFKTLREISQFLELCKGLYDDMKRMEHAIENLEQQNLDLREEMGQMKEQINKIFESNPKCSDNHDANLSTRIRLPYLNAHPYGVPFGWNANTREQPMTEGHE